MKKRQTIQLSEEAIQLLLPFAQKYSFSGAVNNIILRYDVLMRESVPEFSTQQWMVIFASLNGIGISEEITVSPEKLAEIIRHNSHESYAQKMQIDIDALADSVNSLTPNKTSAVVWLFDKYSVQFNCKPHDATAFEIFLSRLYVCNS